ncbi:hypothetical protein IPV08_15910 [Methylobacterium sp. SD274]|uniref:hypothetical protein n=1 Tax=Methylobacterium sp. SD274 TaxID=2782009 RepID=UPI001A964C1B|nr:hypothetical protein [Methylobacterium sp. SD274]MBO1021447.1 hypothetical protein [Methylobacterium sp. SD274]
MITPRLKPSLDDEIAWYREYLPRQGFPFIVLTQPGQPHSYARTKEMRVWLTERDPKPFAQRGWNLRYCSAGIYCVGFRDQILATEFKIHFG